MLSLEEKRNILHKFTELREKQDDLGRYYYYFDDSATKKKIVARELTDSGNGYVYAKYLPEYKNQLYKDGSVSIKDYTAEQFREVVRKSIDSLR